MSSLHGSSKFIAAPCAKIGHSVCEDGNSLASRGMVVSHAVDDVCEELAEDRLRS